MPTDCPIQAVRRPGVRGAALLCLLVGLSALSQARAQEPQLLPPTDVTAPRTPAPKPPEPSVEPPMPQAFPPPAFSIQDSRAAPVSNAIGASPSASEGMINQLDLANQPLLRPASALELVPGLIAQDQTGTVKANVYLLRGFFLDHGTDFSAWIDDVPYNQVNNPHLHGYLDLNSMFPELIQTIDFKKGVYYPEAGDLSSAATVRISMMDSLPYAMLKSEVGKDSYFRELFANSAPLGQGTLLYAVSGEYFNGPWEYPENSRIFDGIIRYTLGDDFDGLRLTAWAYSAVGRTTDGIPLPAVEAGLLNRLGTNDPFEGISTDRKQINLQWWHRADAGDLTKANLYFVDYRFNDYFNETGDFFDPVNGDLVREYEHNMTFGGSASHSWNSSLFGDNVRNTVGIQIRNDDAPIIGDDHVVARNLLNVLDAASVFETNVGVYYNSDVKWGEKVRTELGLRADYFHWDVDDFVLPEENSGKTESKLLEPKGSLILGPWDHTEFYLNGGYGFHTNDARGIFSTESLPLIPISEGGTITPTVRSDPIARSRGAEVGMKTQLIPNLTTTAALWYLRLASELIFDPDARMGVPRGTSERYGVELSNTYRLNGWLTFDADWSASQAHFLETDFVDAVSPAGGTDVPQAVGIVFAAGPTIRMPDGLFGTLRFRYIGPRDLTSDGVVCSRATNEFDMGLGYECQRFTAGVNILNLFNSNGHDNDFEGDSAENGVQFPNSDSFHALQPFQARFYVTLRW
jgi:TonB-dependent Receptor Plug Domain